MGPAIVLWTRQPFGAKAQAHIAVIADGAFRPFVNHRAAQHSRPWDGGRTGRLRASSLRWVELICQRNKVVEVLAPCFAIDRVSMGFDGSGADSQEFPDGTRGLKFCSGPDHIDLAFGKPVEIVRFCLIGVHFDHFCNHVRRAERVTAQNRLCRRFERAAGCRSCNCPIDPKPKRPEPVASGFVRELGQDAD